MKNTISCSMIAVVAAMLTFAGSTSAQSVWTKQMAPVMTVWGEQLTEDNAWQEYPRPSMKREDWMNLNGVWRYFKRSTINYDYQRSASAFSKAILVPFPVESALSGIMDKNYSTNRKATHMYRRTFTLPESFSGKNILLHFGAVDWRCYVYVNGQLVGTHDGGSAPFSFDITPFLQEGAEQELQVAVWDPTNGGQPNGKQSVSPSGIWYTPNSGIWQTVWLEPVSPTHIESYEPIPDIDNSSVSINVKTSALCTLTLMVKDGDNIIAEQTGISDQTFVFSIPSPKLWSPDEPNLYNLDITVNEQGQEVDKVSGYFGMRKFSRGMVDGHPCILLNNQPLYMYGPLDQGWWPDGLLTPPSYEAMIYDLQVMKDFGMNMVRKHIKLENDLWFDWCDKHGLVVWQDMPSGCESGAIGNLDYAMENFYRENEALIEATRHHPCIGAWVVLNEGWGQHASQGMAHTMRAVNSVIAANHDPGRFVHAVTGWTDVEMGDFLDVHSYPSPNAATNALNERVASCGEFGGINLFIENHMWAGSDVNYTTVEDADTYANLYDHYTDRLQELQKEKGLWMSVYTQITDVEQECNGILTYDRKVLKVSPEQQATMRAKIERTINSRFKDVTTIVPAGDTTSGIQWKYTTTQPASDWYSVDFDASSWRSGAAGFGGGGRTAWSSSDIWIRRNFTINNFDASQLQELRLWLFHDEDAEIYINGKLAAKMTGYNTKYETWPILPEALQALKLDGSDNVIAIHCKQTTGGQFIDCGLKLRSYISNDDLQVDPMPAKTPAPEFQAASGKAYLLTYTLPTSKTLHYAYSFDGAKWTTINGNRGVLTGEFANLEMTSPFIRRANVDGKDVFHLVADLADENAYGFYHLQSEDLVNWTVGDNGNILIKPSSTDASKVESPEWIYSETISQYFVYWSAKNGSKNSINLCTTKDWKRFSTPRSLYAPSFSAYDMHIEKTDDAYTAFFYTSDRGICQTETNNLRVTGTSWAEAQRLFSSQIPKSRAPQTFPAFDNSGWFLLYNFTENARQAMSHSGNVEEKKWYPCDENELTLPEEAQEGSVLVISQTELATLLASFNNEEFDLLPTAEIEPQMWKYQTSSSASTNTAWTLPSYDDRNWQEGLSGFGANNPPGSFVSTTWTSFDIRLRYHLDLTDFTPEQMSALSARIHHDEDVTVWFNGVEAFQESGYLTAYKSMPINQEALDALTPDANNIIAIECTNRGGGAYIDFGLSGIRPIPTGIETIRIEENKIIGNGGIYDLQGRKVTSLQKGVYIKDGKKIITANP
ncbi:MAG: glycoside hydrolase family 2 [Bacteroidaceae bacterium]|nr:glycoside hydrolase family 2 [Bacteroidaceae bacterium]